MKNKFLLLGATALLSTGLAMNAMAEGYEYSTDMSVKVRVVAPSGITKLQDVDFGTVLRSNQEYVRINPETGTISIPNYDPDEDVSAGMTVESYVVGKHNKGLFSVAWTDPGRSGSTAINFDHSVPLKNSYGRTITYEPEIVKIDSTDPYSVDGEDHLDNYAVGGKLKNLSSNTPTGDYSGSFTITFVYTPGA